MRVAIIGNSIVSNLAAMYFRKTLHSSVEIYLIGPDDRQGLPIVGESIIENTTNFLENKLGLGEYLCKNHYPKFGLTYYFKLDPENPEDRTYSVHCNERGPDDLKPLESWNSKMTRPPSWLLNRKVFDRDIKKMVSDDHTITRINGILKDVALESDKKHELTIETSEKKTIQMESDWVIDVTGRKQFLARKLGLNVKPSEQRDCFWFHLADFDRELLKNLDALGPFPPAEGEKFHYDRYYTTHHFMGKGNWIWLIPLKAEDGSELMSVGFVSRPDVYEQDVRSVSDFDKQVSRLHPVVTDLVKSGKVTQTNLLKRYHYLVNKVYSPDRWAIVGDAAFAPDPLFSNGLAFCTIQLEQLGEMIQQDCDSKHSPEFVNALSEAFLAPVAAAQNAITHWYPTMDDPFLSSLRLTWIEIAYFYMVLPLVINKCHYDPERTGLWNILQFRPDNSAFDIDRRLLHARKEFDKVTADHFLYIGKEKVNPRAMRSFDNIKDIQAQILEGGRLRNEYVLEVLKRIDQLMAVEI